MPFPKAYILFRPSRLSSTVPLPPGSFPNYPGFGRDITRPCSTTPSLSVGSLIYLFVQLWPELAHPGAPASLSMRGTITPARKTELQTQFPQLPLTSHGICISKGFGFALRPEATKCLNTVGNKENTVCSVQRMTFPYYRKKKRKFKN